MKKWFLKGVIFIFCLCTSSLVEAGGGLATELGEVVIQNLVPGESYNLTGIANLPLVVINTGDTEVDIKVDVLIPEKGGLREGYEAIPDSGWVTLSKDSFKGVGTKQRVVSDIIISIPDDIKYWEKKYQVNIWSHTGSSEGGMIGVGLMSRVLFTTVTKVKEGVPPEEEEVKKGLRFNLLPHEVHIKGVRVGRIYDVKEQDGVVIKIKNLDNMEHTYQIESLRVAESFVELTKGYQDCPNPYFLIFEEQTFKIPAKGEKNIQMWVVFPYKREYRGKNYEFIIQAIAIDQAIPVRIYSKVYVSLR